VVNRVTRQGSLCSHAWHEALTDYVCDCVSASRLQDPSGISRLASLARSLDGFAAILRRHCHGEVGPIAENLDVQDVAGRQRVGVKLLFAEGSRPGTMKPTSSDMRLSTLCTSPALLAVSHVLISSQMAPFNCHAMLSCRHNVRMSSCSGTSSLDHARVK